MVTKVAIGSLTLIGCIILAALGLWKYNIHL
jgi:hypothetical protein